MTSHEVCITGLGAVSGYGWGIGALEPVFNGRTAVRERSVGTKPGSPTIVCACTDQELPLGMFSRHIEDADRVVKMSVFAAHEAMAMAGIKAEDVGLVSWGTGFGGADTLDKAYTHLLFDRAQLATKVPPMTIPKAMAHASASGIAACFGLTCPTLTYSTACSSSAVAIAQAALAIEYGRCDVAIVGGAEALVVPGVVKAWDSLSALAKSDSPIGIVGPFDANRSGLYLGEGAGCLVLESAGHAYRRSAKVLGRLCGHGHVTDHQCVTKPDPHFQVQSMREALKMARINADEVAYVNAHGTGTQAGDRAEIQALNEVFADTATLVSSTKGLTGHLMGASGAIESVIVLLSLDRKQLPPNQPLRMVDSSVNFKLLSQPSAVLAQSYAMSNSFAFGGSNVSLIFQSGAL
jgi:3-oxoacyl-(acyl-carrier-protein) synthase